MRQFLKRLWSIRILKFLHSMLFISWSDWVVVTLWNCVLQYCGSHLWAPWAPLALMVLKSVWANKLIFRPRLASSIGVQQNKSRKNDNIGHMVSPKRSVTLSHICETGPLSSILPLGILPYSSSSPSLNTQESNSCYLYWNEEGYGIEIVLKNNRSLIPRQNLYLDK